MQDKRRWLPRWQRVELVELCLQQGLTRRQAAAWRRVSVSTVQYWVARYRAAGAADRVCETRARTGWGPRLIACDLGMAHATVSRCLRRRGVSRQPKAPREPVQRFEWPCPGALIQNDTKRFARFSRPGHAVTGDRTTTGAQKRESVGYEIAHSAIDDHSRLAYTELHLDEKAATVLGFTQRAMAFFAAHGITIERWQTDNTWTSTRNTAFQALLTAHGIRHRTIPPRTPKRNGKAERYQQTLKREWALEQRYRSSHHRAAALPHWLHHYNNARNHSSIGNRPPITRVRNHLRQNS
jgi:transposase InsO family protein